MDRIKEMKEENWKDINGYEGKYKISSHGRIMSINGRYNGEKLMNPAIGKKEGYYITCLRINGKKKHYRIHRLVAEAFIENSEKLDSVNHKDGNKLNNHVENLEWLSRGDNTKHAFKNKIVDFTGSNHHNSKLIEKDVINIRLSYQMGLTHKQIGEIYGICRRQAGDIINGINWGHVPIPDYSKRPKIKYKRK